MSECFHIIQRVYYEDTDFSGVVYHANYLRFFERARTEWLRLHGVQQDQMLEKHNLVFTIPSIEVQYHRAARFDDVLAVSVEVLQAKRASMIFAQEIRRDTLDGELLCSARVRAACVNYETWRPTPLPANLRDQITALTRKDVT